MWDDKTRFFGGGRIVSVYGMRKLKFLERIECFSTRDDKTQFLGRIERSSIWDNDTQFWDG